MFVLNKTHIRDTYILKLHLFVAKCLGIYPFAFGKKIHNLGKIITWIVPMFSVVMSLIKVYILLTKDGNLASFGIVLNLLYGLTQSAFYVSLLFNSVTKIEDWDCLMVKLSQFDYICCSQDVKIDRKNGEFSVLYRFA